MNILFENIKEKRKKKNRINNNNWLKIFETITTNN